MAACSSDRNLSTHTTDYPAHVALSMVEWLTLEILVQVRVPRSRVYIIHLTTSRQILFVGVLYVEAHGD